MRTNLLALIASSVLLFGCKQTPLFAPEPTYEQAALDKKTHEAEQLTEPQRATVIDITPTMKAEIQQAIVSLNGGMPPLLSDTVFVHSSELLLERGRASTELSIAVQNYRLQKRNIGCVLYHPASQKYVLLKTVPCQVEELK